MANSKYYEHSPALSSVHEQAASGDIYQRKEAIRDMSDDELRAAVAKALDWQIWRGRSSD